MGVLTGAVHDGSAVLINTFHTVKLTVGHVKDDSAPYISKVACEYEIVVMGRAFQVIKMCPDRIKRGRSHSASHGIRISYSGIYDASDSSVSQAYAV